METDTTAAEVIQSWQEFFDEHDEILNGIAARGGISKAAALNAVMLNKIYGVLSDMFDMMQTASEQVNRDDDEDWRRG